MGRKGTRQPVADMLVDTVSTWEVQRGAGWEKAQEIIDRLTHEIADVDGLIGKLTDVRAQLVQEKDAWSQVQEKEEQSAADNLKNRIMEATKGEIAKTSGPISEIAFRGAVQAELAPIIFAEIMRHTASQNNQPQERNNHDS
jgi:hypothetical protein